jgi:Tfp pilus assembly protein PilW
VTAVLIGGAVLLAIGSLYLVARVRAAADRTARANERLRRMLEERREEQAP